MITMSTKEDAFDQASFFMKFPEKPCREKTNMIILL